MHLFSKKPATDDRAAKLDALADTVITTRDASDFSGRRISGRDVQRSAAGYGLTVTDAEAEQALTARLRHRGIR